MQFATDEPTTFTEDMKIREAVSYSAEVSPFLSRPYTKLCFIAGSLRP